MLQILKQWKEEEEAISYKECVIYGIWRISIVLWSLKFWLTSGLTFLKECSRSPGYLKKLDVIITLLIWKELFVFVKTKNMHLVAILLCQYEKKLYTCQLWQPCAIHHIHHRVRYLCLAETNENVKYKERNENKTKIKTLSLKQTEK